MQFNFLGNNNEFEFREDSWRKLLRECMEYDIDKINELADNEFRSYQTHLRFLCLFNRIFCVVQLFFILAAVYCCYKQTMRPVVVFVATILQYLCFWVKMESTLVNVDRAKTKYDMLCYIRDENVFKQYKITPFANSKMTFYDLGQKYEYCNDGKITPSRVSGTKVLENFINKVSELKPEPKAKEGPIRQKTDTRLRGRGVNPNNQEPSPLRSRPITNPMPRQKTETPNSKVNNKTIYDDLLVDTGLGEYYQHKKVEEKPEIVYVEKPVEKIVYKDRIIEKEVPVEKIVEKEVPVEKIVYKEKPIPKKKSIHNPKVAYKDVFK